MIAALAAAIVFGGERVSREFAVFEGWHEFYLMAGTASVTLVGLLFVALSFNLDVLLHDTRRHLLSHAREAMISFLYVLLLSLLFLVPDHASREMGFSIVAISAVMIALGVFSIVRSRRLDGSEPHEKFIGRRRRIALVGHLAAIFIGVTMAAQRDSSQAIWMVGVVCLQLVNAAGSSWDLLVEVGKIKRTLESEKR